MQFPVSFDRRRDMRALSMIGTPGAASDWPGAACKGPKTEVKHAETGGGGRQVEVLEAERDLRLAAIATE